MSHYISGNGAFGTNHANRDRGNLPSLEWWDMHGSVAPQLQHLATQMLSQVVNTSSIERCWSTYSFIHSVKRNRLNVNQARGLVYVHYNLRLLSHYCEESKEDKSFKTWDYNPEEDNLEDEALVLEQLENALFDDDDGGDMPPLSTSMIPLTRTPIASAGPSRSVLPPHPPT